MLRPKSIDLFERCYLGGWAVGLINTLISWTNVRQDPRIIAAAEQVGSWYLSTITAIGLAIPLILWFFIARKGSVVAKWIMVGLTALGVAGLALSFARGQYPAGIAGILGLAGVVLNIAAAAMLFRPDAKPWFGEDSPREPVA
ncbi:hypothetical protein ACFSC3_05100 [Sphingomonas floccifaciens]|uniref:Sugar transporter n=1 Tax=Sphingomonas floccifaciens TaxID=1844115 RepID=A0ABW4NA22_9SPHN